LGKQFEQPIYQARNGLSILLSTACCIKLQTTTLCRTSHASFNANINNIISYNNLVDDSDINPGDLIIIPGGTVAAQSLPQNPHLQLQTKLETK